MLRRTLTSIREEVAGCRRFQRERRRFVLREKAMYAVLNSVAVHTDWADALELWSP